MQGETRQLLSTVAYLRPYRRSWVAIVAVSLVSLALALVGPLLYGTATDAIVRRQLERLWPVLGWLLAVSICQYVASLALTYWKARLEASIARDVRLLLHAKILRMAVSAERSSSHGDLISRVEGDVQAVGGVALGLVLLAPQLVGAVGALAMAFALSAKLSLLYLACLPLVAAGSVIWGNVLKRRHAQLRLASDRHIQYLQETIAGSREIRLLGARDIRDRQYDVVSAEKAETGVGLQVSSALAEVSISGLTLVASLGVTAVAAVQIAGGLMTIGQFVSFGAYSAQMTQSIKGLAGYFYSYRQLSVSVSRIYEVLEQRDEQAGVGGSTVLPGTGEVAFRGVRFGYETSRPILEGISCAFPPRTMTAIVGLSGAGKTTLIGLMTKLYAPESGTVEYDGIDLQDIDTEALRRVVAVVSQNPFFFRMSIHDNMLLARPDASERDIKEACRMSDTLDFINRSQRGLDSPLGDRGEGLSAGQLQRLALARALLRKPRVLVCDEPTANLDARTERRVLATLRGLSRRHTVLVVTHRLSVAASSDFVVVLSRGKVVGMGTHADLAVNSPLYVGLLGMGRE